MIITKELLNSGKMDREIMNQIKVLGNAMMRFETRPYELKFKIEELK